MTPVEQELVQLTSALVDENINEVEFARLNELIERDAAAQSLYIRLLHHHADLAELVIHDAANCFDANSIASPLCEPNDKPSLNSKQSLSTVLAVLTRKALQAAKKPTSISLTVAIGVVGILICGMSMMAIPFYRQTLQPAENVEVRAVAKITREHQAEWSTDLSAASSQRFLCAGDRIELRTGFVEVYFYDGASVILEGPCAFQVLSSDSARLDRGQLSATVPKKAIGFSVRSPCLNVVDLGTEFGVLVEKNGATKVNVFVGRVQVTSIAPAASPTKQMTLAAGEAARFANNGSEIERLKQDSTEFVNASDLNNLINDDRHQQWRDFTASLKDDPDVIALYTFNRLQQSPALVQNLAVSHLDSADGRIAGPQWTAGRWKEKSALRFRKQFDSVQIDLTGVECEQLTLVAWVNIDYLQHVHTALLHSNNWQREGAVHWTMLEDGRMELAIGGSQTQPAIVQSNPEPLPRLLQHWNQLAVTYDSQGKQVRFYFNGKPLGVCPLTTAALINLDRAQIGNWTEESRNLIGRMDDLIIYRRALSAEEIRQLYTAGAP